MKNIEQYKQDALQHDIENHLYYLASLRGRNLEHNLVPSSKRKQNITCQDHLDYLNIKLPQLTEEYHLRVDWDNPISVEKFLRCFMVPSYENGNIISVCSTLQFLRSSKQINIINHTTEKLPIDKSLKEKLENYLEGIVLEYLETSNAIEDFMDVLMWDEGIIPASHEISIWTKDGDNAFTKHYIINPTAINDAGLNRIIQSKGTLEEGPFIRFLYHNLIHGDIMDSIPRSGAGITTGYCALYDLMNAIGFFQDAITTKNDRPSEIRKSKRDRVKRFNIN